MKVVLVGIEFLEKAGRELIEALSKCHLQIAQVEATPSGATQIAKERPDLLMINNKTLPKVRSTILHDIGEQFPECTIVLTTNARPNRLVRNILAHGVSLPSKNRRKDQLQSYSSSPDIERGVSGDLDFIRFLDQLEDEESTANQQTLAKLMNEANGNGAKMFPQPPRVILPELHDPNNGRLDAERFANYLGIPLSKLAAGLKVNYGTVHKTPSAESLQPALRTIKRSLEILTEVVGNRETVLAWLNSPHPDLDKETPLQLIQEGRAEELEAILENAVAAIPY